MRYYRASALLVAAFAVMTATLVLAQNADCSTRKCIHLPLIARPLVEPPGVELPNGGFEQGATVWTFSAGAQAQLDAGLAHSGNWSGVLTNAAATTTLQQSVSVPANAEYLLIWYTASSTESDCNQNLGTVEFDDNPADAVEPEIYASILEFCASKQFTVYKQKRIYVEPFAGRQVSLIFALDTFGSAPVEWRLDDLRWQIAS